MMHYSVKKLAKLAGVSVRTLHHYDRVGLLKPKARTEARYRLYSETELLRLQQILFYKELDFSLNDIKELLDDPEFDVLKALTQHKAFLQARQARISTLLVTIDKTMFHLKNGTMLTHEELYEGLSKDKAEAYRKEAHEKWPEQASHSEDALRKMSKPELHQLKEAAAANLQNLITMCKEDPASDKVQAEVSRHYGLIRQFWGTEEAEDKQAEAYTGLGDLFVSDPRYTTFNGQPNPEFALFMSKAMRHFAQTRLI